MQGVCVGSIVTADKRALINQPGAEHRPTLVAVEHEHAVRCVNEQLQTTTPAQLARSITFRWPSETDRLRTTPESGDRTLKWSRSARRG